MRYKITKYKGKSKIKDTKTGNSVDIDIEKFMNGGYKTISKYYLGGEECPEGDLECMKEKKRLSGIIDETSRTPMDRFYDSNGLNDSSDLYSKSAETEEDSVKKDEEVDYNIPNPYAGVDIPTAAFTLGQSIENKNTLGTIGSSLKLLTGLGRNFAAGLGAQNRYNQVMKDYFQDQKDNRNPVKYLEQGGKGDEDLATGEYMTGVDNENTEKFNAEIEKGEYFQTNQGDIAEVVGKKHSQGGEKVQMEPEDRVLSDSLKLGAKTAKMLSSKYDLKLKAKNTYSDVLDKFRKKMKLDELVEEESEILKKINDQEKVSDITTKNFNLQVLAEKQKEIQNQKHPIEEMRKGVFDELFQIQEDSKSDKNKKDYYNEGGEKEKLNQEDKDIINESTGANFTTEGVNQLFEKINPDFTTTNPDFNLGKYDGLNYFDINYENDEFNIIPTKQNPGNESKYKEYIQYLQKQNPNLKVNNKGYLPFNRRLEYGGKLEELAKEYGVPLERAKQLVEEFSKGGKLVSKYEKGVQIGEIDPITGEKVTKELAEQKVKSGEWEHLGGNQYIERGTVASTQITENDLKTYAETWDKNKFPNFQDYVTAAEQWKKDNPDWRQITKVEGTPDKFFYTEEKGVTNIPQEDIKTTDFSVKLPSTLPDASALNISEEKREELRRNSNLMGAYLFPDESPLPPSALQGSIKPERRFDRVRPTEIDVEPYLQDLRDREKSQVQSLEGLSPNVRAAVLANMRANTQKAESEIRNQIDTQNLQSQERAIYTNAQIQQREENASEQDRLGYEQRVYRAQALTNNDLNDYFNQLQAINKQRFMDIHNLNLINATNEDVAYLPGRGFVRKNSDQDIIRKINLP